MRRAVALLIAAAGLAVAAPASACSVVPGYAVPTGLEMAAEADMIVVATVTGRTGTSQSQSGVFVKPTLLIKGSALPTPFLMSGAYLSTSRYRATRSAPRELRAPNSDALAGSCSRYLFTPGMRLVLFLKRGANGKIDAIRAPFSRDSEDVAGPRALWVKAVREYAAIGALPDAARKDALRKRIAELRARKGDRDAAAIAADMEIELNHKPRPLRD